MGKSFMKSAAGLFYMQHTTHNHCGFLNLLKDEALLCLSLTDTNVKTGTQSQTLLISNTRALVQCTNPLATT